MTEDESRLSRVDDEAGGRARGPVGVLPAALEAERGILGAYLARPKEVGAICAEMRLESAAFHLPGHRLIYDLVATGWAIQKPLDTIELTRRLDALDRLEEVGGAANICSIADIPSVMNIRLHVETVQTKKKVRDCRALCQAAIIEAGTSEDAESLIGSHMEKLAALLQAGERGYTPWSEHLDRKLHRLVSEEADEDFIPTGIAWIDENSPMKRKDFPVVTGPTKSGKSILAASIARNVCQAGGAVLYASLEQPDAEQVDRLIAGAAKVDYRKDHHTKLANFEEHALHKALRENRGWRMDLRDGLHDVTALIGAIRQAKLRWDDLHLVIVDYIQLLKGKREKGETREIEVAGVSHLLRRTGMDTNCVMLILCQTNQDGQARESKAIDQDTTAKWVIHPGRRNLKDSESDIRKLEIPFQRKGHSGIETTVIFEGPFATVRSAEEHEQAEFLEVPPSRKKRYRNQTPDDQ